MTGLFQGRKVLVTGGAGFIGSNLALRLVAEGARVTVIDSMSVGCGGNLFNLDPVKNQIRFLPIDLCALRDEKNFVSGWEYDFIFNLAGNISHIDSMNHPFSDLADNVIAHLALLEVARARSPKAKVVYASTRQVYGKAEYLPVDETHALRPVDVNGAHKLCAEEYHRVYGKAYGLPTVVLRLTNTYGPRQLIRHNRQGVAGAFFGAAIRGEKISLFSSGEQRRDFSFVDDVVDAFLLAATRDECVGKVFNLSGETASLRDFSAYISEHVPGLIRENSDFPPERKAIDIGEFMADSSAFTRITGWEPRVRLSEGVRLTLAYYREHKNNYL